ncbi:MAG TPA: arginine--tRNA ligase [Patescibacteria group bacterium]
MNVQDEIKHLITKAVLTLNLAISEEIHLEHPANADHGDYSTNVAMKLFREQEKYKNLGELAQAIADAINSALESSSAVNKVEVAGPGFINFYLSDTWLIEDMNSKTNGEMSIQKVQGKKAVIEYMQPNTNKPLHVGHLRNAILGWSLIQLLEAQGWQVHKATINNDRGLHIIKSMWGYLTQGRRQSGETKAWRSLIEEWVQNSDQWVKPSDMEDERLNKPDHFAGHWYVQADKEAENEKVIQEWKEMLIAWESKTDEYHQSVRKLWQQLNHWFYEGYQESAELIGFTFDPEYVKYESDIYEAGRHIILDAEKKGVFIRLDSGAVQAKLAEYNLPDKILLRSDGTGIYMTFDIELTRQRSQLDADLLVWVVGNDQALYFQQLFAIGEMLGYGKREDFKHFAYGMVRLPEGKMSSRKGRVVFADDILEMAMTKAKQIMAETGSQERLTESEYEEVAKEVGVGAVKWTMLGQDPLSELTFDVDTSVSFKGYAAPFVQYTHARCRSILSKVGKEVGESTTVQALAPDEKTVLRLMYQFPEVVQKAAEEFAPHHVAVYLFELAQAYNAFYTNCPVLSADNEATKAFRLQLTAATANVLKEGLRLLGIQAPEKM